MKNSEDEVISSENRDKPATMLNSGSYGVKHLNDYVTRLDAEHQGELKTASDGHTVLVPQPSEDHNDPLNWSPVKKHLILLIISFAAFLPDYGSATGAVTLLPQAA